jgi:hypothetical protein
MPTTLAAPALAVPSLRSIQGLITIIVSLLIFVPLLVLGVAIGWPGSLRGPADAALPRLLDHEFATRLGYAPAGMMTVGGPIRRPTLGGRRTPLVPVVSPDFAAEPRFPRSPASSSAAIRLQTTRLGGLRFVIAADLT